MKKELLIIAVLAIIAITALSVYHLNKGGELTLTTPFGKIDYLKRC